MADVFISYKSERRPAARHLSKVLNCYGFDVWYDYGLVPGDDFEPTILSEIARAKVVLVLWCGMAAASEWVIKEAREARRNAKYLPCRVENCVLPDEFAGADTINLTEWDASPRSHLLDRLLDEIGRRVDREPASRISSLRSLEEDWRGYGAPSLTYFALGRALGPDTLLQPKSAHSTSPIGPPPAGISPNLSQHWESAEAGHTTAIVSIGIAYFDGADGLARDEPKAVRCWQYAAEKGCAAGQAHLGLAYFRGEGGLVKNAVEAVRLWRLSAAQGHARGQLHLGVAYEHGQGGLTVDKAEAVRLYKLSVAQGQAQAQANLGLCYDSGIGGLNLDYAEAVRLFTLAANQGNQSGQYNLGRMHYHGRQVAQDHSKAAYFYRLAADQGHAAAQCTLGAMIENGEGGLSKDRTAAIALYQSSARSGNEMAQKNLIRLGASW